MLDIYFPTSPADRPGELSWILNWEVVTKERREREEVFSLMNAGGYLGPRFLATKI